MKRHRILTAAFVLLLSSLPVASAFAKPVKTASAAAWVIFRVEGVIIKKPKKGKEAQRRLPAFAKTAVKPGDEIRTHAHARAELHLSDGVIVRLKEGSRLTIGSLESKRKSLNADLRLSAGEALVKVAKRWGFRNRIKVRTPTAVAAVRGTTFVIEIEKNETDIKVLEGTVEVASIDHEETFRAVEAGHELSVLEAGPLAEPVEIPAAELAQDNEWAQEPETEVVAGDFGTTDDAEPAPEGAAPEAEATAPEIIEPGSPEEIGVESPEVEGTAPEDIQPPEPQ